MKVPSHGLFYSAETYRLNTEQPTLERSPLMQGQSLHPIGSLTLHHVKDCMDSSEGYIRTRKTPRWCGPSPELCCGDGDWLRRQSEPVRCWCQNSKDLHWHFIVIPRPAFAHLHPCKMEVSPLSANRWGERTGATPYSLAIPTNCNDILTLKGVCVNFLCIILEVQSIVECCIYFSDNRIHFLVNGISFKAAAL
jgi:hypothetical protein